jgi:hypothetical protein
MIGDPKRHCRRHPQRFMRAVETVKTRVKADRRKVAIDLLAKAVAQSGKPS